MVPGCSKSTVRVAFSHQALALWNKLPAIIKEAETAPPSKHNLKPKPKMTLSVNSEELCPQRKTMGKILQTGTLLFLFHIFLLLLLHYYSPGIAFHHSPLEERHLLQTPADTTSKDGLLRACLTSDPGNVLVLPTSSLDSYIWNVLVTSTACLSKGN